MEGNAQHPRSAFAESAYAHARSSSSRRRQEDEDYNLMYYDDGANDLSNVAQAEFQPLAGASVVIIVNTSKTDKVTNARTLRLMEERESIGCAVQSLGGKWVSTLEDGETITHSIWVDCEEDQPMTSETSVKLNTCLFSRDIPVVGPKWLSGISELSPGQHWSEVDVEEYVPRTIKLFADVDVNSGRTHSASNDIDRLGRSASRRDDAKSLSESIGQTYRSLLDENPDVMDEEALRRAMELSMLDFAIVHHTPNKMHSNALCEKGESPHEILQIDENASPEEIKNAYRRRALETHPDKGGEPGEFDAVARAYRKLLNNAQWDGSFDREDGKITLKSTAHWDSELKEHHNLVQELYQNHGESVDDNLKRQSFTLERLGLTHKDAGSRGRNERNQVIQNSCFYLSLAASYLSGIGALTIWDKFWEDNEGDADTALLRKADERLISDTALQLKRVIEAAVLSAHPEWAAKQMVGEEVQAFSDFLVYILESNTIVSDWAVVVFDTSSGFVDIYKGQHYKDEGDGVEEACAASNTLALRFVRDHYQPLVAASSASARPALKHILSVLDESGVMYVVTDGAAPENKS